MNNYKFNDNTLLHSCGFNFASFVSIMKNGIMSFDYAQKNNVSFSKNYVGSNLDDTISCVRYLYVNPSVKDGSYAFHIMNGISFIIEDVDFIYDKNERIIHRSDEVLVKDYIPVSKIVGIICPDKFLSYHLDELEYIKNESTSYSLIKRNADIIKNFINNGTSCDDYYNELYYINEAYKAEKDVSEKNALRNDFFDTISSFNQFIGSELELYFKKKLNRDDIVFPDVIEYLNDLYLKLPIYYISGDSKMKK